MRTDAVFLAAARVSRTKADNLGQGKYVSVLKGQAEKIAERSSRNRPKIYCNLQFNR